MNNVIPDKYNYVLCRYSEIALKGKNRWRFEQFLVTRINKLLANKKGTLSERSNFIVRKIRGRILIHLSDEQPFSQGQIRHITDSMHYVFGVDSFSFALKTTPSIDSIARMVDETVFPIIDACKKNSAAKLMFRVRLNRVDKKFPVSTRNAEIHIADIVLAKFPGLKVNLIKADVNVYVEVYKDNAFVYYEMIKGQCGLPIGSNPPVLALLSGGFDSPVASYMMMKRGVFVDFLTFHSYPFTPQATIDKVKKIVDVLNRFQGNRKLFICNFLEVQKIIVAETLEQFRTVHYRRIMLKIAEMIALKNKNKALVTGESVGQVASQTIVNLNNIDSAAEMLVLRPLAAIDKLDTMKIASEIGTYEVSKEQLPDSCTVFLPQNPSTAAPRHVLLRFENRLDMKAILKLAWDNTVIYDPETQEETPVSRIWNFPV